MTDASTAFRDLPYAYDSLEPYISAKTLEVHHDRHHRGYIEKVKALVSEVVLTERTLEDIVRHTVNQPCVRALYDNAAQAWNHEFYWHCMRPGGGGTPYGAITNRLVSDFGTYEAFAEQFAAVAARQFGSGWAWLVLEGETLKVTATSNADTPIAHGLTPLLSIDVWEHAYYLDYYNRRSDYIAAYLKYLVNWDFANQNLMRALDVAGQKSRDVETDERIASESAEA